MERIVHGAKASLMPGEKQVLDLLLDKLTPSWEIYVQPHLNGRRPDFVLLNPQVGTAVIEVKDWKTFERSDRSLHNAGPYMSDDEQAEHVRRIDPAEQVLGYKKEIYELYCPRLEQRSGFAAINAVLVFPFLSDAEVQERFSHRFRSRYDVAFGRETLQRGDIQQIIPASAYSSSKIMSSAHAEDLRSWLIEPDHERSKREPLVLDARQRDLADSRTSSGYRRIKGPAGSGKSLIVASRAARLSARGKSVLVVTYNITLIAYLRDLAMREPNGSIGNIVWINFHELCRRLCEDLDLMDEYSACAQRHRTQRSEGFFHEVPAVIRRHLDSMPRALHVEAGLPQFDAVIVDEGQDYTLDWWKLLRHLHRDNGEMLLVADTTQDLYDTAQAWTEDEMPGSGFAGPWATLDISYRLPPELTDLANEFSQRFVSDQKRVKSNAQTRDLGIEPCTLSWTQCEPHTADRLVAEAAMHIISASAAQQAAMTDLTILVATKENGRRVAEALALKNIKTLTTFNDFEGNDMDAKSEERRKKLAFRANRPFVKISTIHSFKGWEARLLVVHIDKARSVHGLTGKDFGAIYAAITRLKRDPKGSALSIICAEPTFQDYATLWPEFRVA